VVHYVVKLLACPVPHSNSGTRGLFVDNMSMLSAVLRGASSVDTLHILSLHGVVSESLKTIYFIFDGYRNMIRHFDSLFQISKNEHFWVSLDSWQSFAHVPDVWCWV